MLLLLLPNNRYDGWDTTNSLHDYSYTTTVWDQASPPSVVSSTFGAIPPFATAPHPVTSINSPTDLSLNVAFVDSATLTLGDTWTILISSCGKASPLEEGVSATLTSKDGTAPVNQLTLDRGYEGTVPGSHDVYSVNQHFTVRASGERG